MPVCVCVHVCACTPPPTADEHLDHRAKERDELISKEFGVHEPRAAHSCLVMRHVIFTTPAVGTVVIYSFCKWRQACKAK